MSEPPRQSTGGDELSASRLHILRDPDASSPAWLKTSVPFLTAGSFRVFLFDLLNGDGLGDITLALPAVAVLVAACASRFGYGHLFDKRQWVTLEGDTVEWRTDVGRTTRLGLATARTIDVKLTSIEFVAADGRPATLPLDFLPYADVRRVKAWVRDYLARRA